MNEQDKTTDERIAELIQQQTYAERMDLARYLANASSDWIQSGEIADHDYFATLLESWAESTLEGK